MLNGRTTIAGILTMLIPIGVAILKLVQGQPITETDMAMLSAAVTSGMGLYHAKDAVTPTTTVTQQVEAVGPATIQSTQ